MLLAIKPFEIHDGDGIRTTVFFKGCPLRCRWCHNPESFVAVREMMFDPDKCCHCLKCVNICPANMERDGTHTFVRDNCVLCGKCETVCPNKAFEITGLDMSPEQLAERLLKDEVFWKGSGGGVTFSGGEPLMQVEFCVETAKILKRHGVHVAVDTSGFVKREVLDAIIPYMDTFLFDIKAIDEEVHVACTGVSNKLILENIAYVDSLGIPFEIRYPYVPTMNDGEAEKIAHFVKNLKHMRCFRILPYHNYAASKYACLGLSFTDFPVPSKAQMQSVLEDVRRCGVKNTTCFHL